MKELAAVGIPVAVTCRVLKLSRRPYYRWLAVLTGDVGRTTFSGNIDLDTV